ncbi:DUF1573 domain-containing protein [Polycladomyces sp. WAk]|uniref:DUF1573 domain-containing protein n=1 Tax=Polycladomyces zharkentensis TaxID=2807616 RepID=A0ABS2WI64_9BACL|nr:DUF1573 domain-containing protein [Polycladomyces sp. WAk]MBN2909242.1 DUF1573 domain-containing protein [Polycladomyces sp. WAk]
MGDSRLTSFQKQVSDLLLRHRSFLDVTSKFQDSTSRVNRALMKAVTECGCIEVHAARQPLDYEASISELKDRFKTHLSGCLCDHCQDVVKAEMGKHLFYFTALCNLLELPLDEIVHQESDKLSTLGVFNLR